MAYVAIGIGTVIVTCTGGLIALKMRLTCHEGKVSKSIDAIKELYLGVKIKDGEALATCVMGVVEVMRCCPPEPSLTPSPVKALGMRVLSHGAATKVASADEVLQLPGPENLKSVG